MKKTRNYSIVKQVKQSKTQSFQTLRLNDCAKITGGNGGNSQSTSTGGEEIEEKI